jgi:hypothetical protein
MMSERSNSKPSLSRTSEELRRILRRRERLCPVCLFVRDAVDGYVESLFYERVNDVGTREELRKAGGFCRHHSQTISDHADALGSAIILADLIKQTLREIQAGEFGDEAPGHPLLRFFDARRAVNTTPACPICVKEDELDELGVHALCEALTDREFNQLFEESTGVCIPHLCLAASHREEWSGWSVLAKVEEQKLRDLVKRLNELAETYDYRSKKKPDAALTASWREALNVTCSWLEMRGQSRRDGQSAEKAPAVSEEPPGPG